MNKEETLLDKIPWNDIFYENVVDAGSKARNFFQNSIGKKNTKNKKNAMVKIERDNFIEVWETQKNNAKKYKIPLPIYQEVGLHSFNELSPEFFSIADKLGLDKIETAKILTYAFRDILNSLQESDQLNLIFNNTKEENTIFLEKFLNVLTVQNKQ